MINFVKEDFNKRLKNEDIMDFSDTQYIDDMFNIFQTTKSHM